MFVEVMASSFSISRRRPIHGVGINDSWYMTHNTKSGSRCPYYITWVNMIKRCYSKKETTKNKSYKECHVCEYWLKFSNFRVWMESQDWKGKQLDKDIIKPGNKMYSPEACVFVLGEINLLFTYKKISKHGTGIYFNKKLNLYEVQITTNSKRKHLGRYRTNSEASNKYREVKKAYIMKLASKEKDKRIKEGMLLHAGNLIQSEGG